MVQDPGPHGSISSSDDFPTWLKRNDGLGPDEHRHRQRTAAKHSPIAHVFGTAAGFGALRVEADVLLWAMEEMARRGFHSLPAHDALCGQGRRMWRSPRAVFKMLLDASRHHDPHRPHRSRRGSGAVVCFGFPAGALPISPLTSSTHNEDPAKSVPRRTSKSRTGVNPKTGRYS